jgi:glycosyltransferase involved in cell wall biosynthesis
MGVFKPKTLSIQPLFSIIIPAHNEEHTIRRALESISAQTLRDFEIIVVDDGSIDNTPNIIQLYKNREPRLRLIISNKFGTSAAKARNQGAKQAKGKYLLFHDADCVADNKLLANAEYNFKNVDGIATRTTNTEPQSWVQRAIATQRAIRWENNQQKPILLQNGRFPVNVAIMQREVFKSLGGFDEKIFYFEDNDLTERFFKTGNKAMFVPDVIQRHQDPLTLRESMSQCKSIARGMKSRGTLRLKDILLFLIALYGVVNILPWLIIFVGMSFKSRDVVGSFYFTILWEIRTLTKLFYLFDVYGEKSSFST